MKSSKKDILIPSGKSVKVFCHANTTGLDKRTPVIFEPDEAAPWPDGLSMPETVLCVKHGKSRTVSVEVTNMSNSDISLQGRTVLGRLEPVRSVTPLEVKLVQKEEGSQSDAEGRTVLGRLEPVRSVTPLEVKLVQKEEGSQSDAEGTEEHIGLPEMSKPSVSQPMSEKEKFIPDIDLSD